MLWIEAYSFIRDIYRHHWTGLGTPSEVDSALAVLSEAGWVRVVVIQTEGRRTEVVHPHPELRSRKSDELPV